MDSIESRAVGISLLFGAHGRQLDDHVIEAYHRALEDVTDFQFERAVYFYLRNHTGDHPPTAPEVRTRALKYEPTARAERARIEVNRVAQLPRLEDQRWK